MESYQIFSIMEQALDELIQNSSRLIECEENSEESAALEYQQEILLNTLLGMNKGLDETGCYLLKKSPKIYSVLEKKISCLSRLNRSLLRPSIIPYLKRRKKSTTG